MTSVPSSFAVAALVALNLISPLHARAQAPAAAVTPVATAAELEPPAIKGDAQGMVTLEAPLPGAVIRYSIDGSDPGPKGGPYLAPILLPAGGVVKARVFSEDRTQKS